MVARWPDLPFARMKFAPDISTAGAYIAVMSATTAKLLSEFEALGVEEKQEFVREMIHHLPPWDSGPLGDEVAAAAGDQLAAMIEEEECAS
jgi:hypothetical protein